VSGSARRPRLDEYLARTYRHSSLLQWRSHIAAGRLVLDGAAAEEAAVLESEQELEWHRPAWVEPGAPLHCPVLFEDREVLVVDKPSGLPTLPGAGFLQHTLLHQVRLQHPGVSPVHRLGRWTSGAVLCGRTKAASASLSGQFAARSIGKRYRALASGDPKWDVLRIDVPIGPVPYRPLGTLYAASPEGRPALSSVVVLERSGDSFLCDVTISTGRPHQIRIHLAAVGHPLVGDPLYLQGGQPAPEGTALPGDPGYLLHAAEISFRHPEGGAQVVVTAPLPEGLKGSEEVGRAEADSEEAESEEASAI
jgi:23S rRNA pseudouridine1911/1915/1917 synthase